VSDVHTPLQRSFNMSRIRGADTKPELVLRRGLHAHGLRYRLHVRELPGTPDIVFASHKVAVFVHGCFWHGHECDMFRWPATRADFWRAKIGSNRQRDEHALKALRSAGWRTLVVWECALRGSRKLPAERVVEACVAFAHGTTKSKTIVGRHKRAAAVAPGRDKRGR